MNKQILLFALLLTLSNKSFSQINFENGYFINVSSQKTECLIKNSDWKNNPTEFEYMLFQDTIAQKASIETVAEFGINGVSKFISTAVKIDRSSDKANELGTDRKPNFQEEQLFLKVLIEGKSSLFLYEDGNVTRFFYNINGSEIKQLIYKRYLIDISIAQNNYFKQQIFTDLKCQAILLNHVEHLRYTKRDLERIFIKHNECTSSNFVNYDHKQKKDLFNLSLRPGFNYSNLNIHHSPSDLWDINLDNKLSFRFGIEAEFVLPYNGNKWSIIIEPTYQYYSSEKTIENNRISGGILISEVNYQSIELPIGVRHYFFLNDNSKLFADISCILDFSNSSFIEYKRFDGSVLASLEVKSRPNFGLGAGYKYKNKYSLGMRYQTSREISSDHTSWICSYKTFSVIFGYTLF